VDEKLIAKFQGSWAQGPAMYETVLYAHMKTFRQDPDIVVLRLALCVVGDGCRMDPAILPS
jgi:hypothetical protein